MCHRYRLSLCYFPSGPDQFVFNVRLDESHRGPNGDRASLSADPADSVRTRRFGALCFATQEQQYVERSLVRGSFNAVKMPAARLPFPFPRISLDCLTQKSLDWLLSFQCRDGGWAAFDKDVQNPLLKYLPFADHRAILDPSCPDITGRVLEVLANFGIGIAHPGVRKAVRFLRAKQGDDGSWYGRWGVDYIYGTAHVLRGVCAIGIDMNQKWLARARHWLEAHQNLDDGWGESCASYLDSAEKGRGESTASQTAWSLMGLCAFPDVNRRSVHRGIAFLLERQKPDGTWDERVPTGTGFPGVLYLRYDYYRISWPLRALANYAARLEKDSSPHGLRM
jgi:squalene/oxidosqualene cyclase-like protein